MKTILTIFVMLSSAISFSKGSGIESFDCGEYTAKYVKLAGERTHIELSHLRMNNLILEVLEKVNPSATAAADLYVYQSHDKKNTLQISTDDETDAKLIVKTPGHRHSIECEPHF